MDQDGVLNLDFLAEHVKAADSIFLCPVINTYQLYYVEQTQVSQHYNQI